MSPPSTILVVLRRNLRDALRRRDLAEADAVLTRLEAEDALSAETEGGRLEWLLCHRRDAEAGELAPLLITRHPGSSAVWFLAGWAALRSRDGVEAERRLRESEALDPSPRTRGWIGRALATQRRWDEAEPLLVEASDRWPECTTELAWLYERRGERGRAIATLDRWLASHPDDRYAAEQRQKLAARALPEADALSEVRALLDLGEGVPPPLRRRALAPLLRAGRRDDALRLLAAAGPGEHEALGWECYHARAWDLAVEQFLAALSEGAGSPAFFASLEAAARRSGRVEEVAARYAALAAADPRFWGRGRRLKGR